MHEFELGVWRAIFIHLLRILQSIDENIIVELDQWWVGFQVITDYKLISTSFREIPSFGCNTIWHFAANSSELKKMAAHNFENLLQVSTHTFHMVIEEWHPWSALLRSSMDCSQNHITAQSLNCFSPWHSGMHWQSYTCTMTSPSTLWTQQRFLLVRNFVNLVKKLAPPLRPKNYPKNIVLECASTPRQLAKHVQVKRQTCLLTTIKS